MSSRFKSKPNRKLLITNTNSKLDNHIKLDKALTISHISISPSGRKAIVFGHPPKKKSERLILILDLETLKQTGKIILPEKTEFDNLVFSPDEKTIFGIRVMQGLPVLQFPLENGTNKLAGKEIFRYSKDAKPGLHISSEIVQDGTALEIVRSTGRDTIWLKTPSTLPLKTQWLSEGLHQIKDSIFFSNGLPGDSNRLYIRKVQTGESAILVNPQLVLFHKKDKIQGMELIIRPKISAEEALAAIPPDNPKKYRAAILLATILAEKGSEPVNQYLRTGSVPLDQAEIIQSKSTLEKAIALYNDSTFAEGAIRKLKLLNGLILSRSQDRGSQDSARRLFEELGRKYPKAAYPVNALGEWMNANSMPEEASNILKNSMKLAPKWEVPKQNLWKSYLMVGKTEEARQGLERLIQGNFPTEAGVRLLEIYTQTGDFSRGAFVLKRLNSRYPNSEDVLIGAARFYAAKGVYWRAWKNILKVHQDKPYYPPAMLALMNMPGNAVDKAHFLKECLERYPDQMEVKAEALLFLKQNPNLAKNLPANLQKDVDSAHWKPGIQDLLKKILRENSTKPMLLPVESNFQDLFDFSQQLKNNGHFNEAAQILKQLSEKNRMELRCRFALTGVLLQQKRVKEAEPVLEQINSILLHKNPVDSGKADAIPRLEIRIKEMTIEDRSGLASTVRSEAISDLLDSLVQLRDQAGLKTPAVYIEAVSSLKPQALKQYFQSRLKDDDLGVYQSNLESHFCRNYLNALLLDANGYRAACRNKMETLSKILPENGLSTKWLAETGYFSLKEQSQLQASYNSIAYNANGSSPYFTVNEGNCSIVLNPSEKQFHLNIPFAVDRIFTYSKGVKPEVILIIKNQDLNYSLMQFPSLSKIFPGSYIQVAKLAYRPQMQKLMTSVLTKNGWGIVTEDSSWLVPDTHQAVDIQREGLTGKYHFEVMQNQKTGIYNQDGKITVPIIYDQLVQDFGTYGQFSLQAGLSCL